MRSTINTWVSCIGVENRNLDDNRSAPARRRIAYTAEFIAQHLSDQAKTVLDIGEKNQIGDRLAWLFDLQLDNTAGDLDYDYAPLFYTAPLCWYVYDAVFCLEVLEHLMSPKFFLLKLKKYIDSETQIFISYPQRPHFLWTRYHFHEYDWSRFKYLLNECGYDILGCQAQRYPCSFWSYFKAFRNPLRFFWGKNQLVYARLQEEQ